MGPIALIGVIAAVALPAYRDYLGRRNVEAGLVLAGEVTRAITASFRSTGPSDMSQAAAALGSRIASSPEVSAVESARDGTVTVVYRNRDEIAAGRDRVQIEPVSGGRVVDLSDPANKGRAIDWRCAVAPDRTTVIPKYLPKSCRNPAAEESAMGSGAVALLILTIVAGALLVWGVTKVFPQPPREFAMDLAFLLGLLAVGTLVVVFFPISLAVVLVAWLAWVVWNHARSPRGDRRR